MKEVAERPNDRDPAEQRTLGMLFVTRRCNLDCTYCHMAHDGIPDTPQPILQKGIDLLLAYSNSTLFHWFGGEPLLRFDLIEWGVDYVARNAPDNHNYEHFITTNGLLLHRHLDWLMAHGFKFMLSVDGSLEFQREIRKAFGSDDETYARIDAAIDLLREAKAQFFLNMVVSPENVDQMVDNVAYMHARGVRRVQLAYELGALWTPEARATYLRNLEAAIRTWHRRDGFMIQNSPFSEPVLGNPFFVVDCNGDMFQGCAVVLEKTLPTFNDVARLGHISEVDSLVGRQRDRIGQISYFLKNTKPNRQDWDRLRSNMHLGFQVRHLLTKIEHRP